jgi:hypothetical protein
MFKWELFSCYLQVESYSTGLNTHYMWGEKSGNVFSTAKDVNIRDSFYLAVFSYIRRRHECAFNELPQTSEKYVPLNVN